MEHRLTRRSALKTGTALAAAMALNPSLVVGKEAEAQAKMAIARSKSPGVEPEEIAEEARLLTRAAIDALGGMKRFVSKGQKVWVKPNIGWDRTPEQAANTNPDVVAAIVKMCYEAGAKEVLVGDHTCNKPPQRCYERSGIQAAAEKEGAKMVIFDERKYVEADLKGVVLNKWPIYDDFQKADVKINVPIAKHHGSSHMTLAMKNLMGCISGNRGQLHQNFGDTLVDLYQFFKPDLNVLDAVRVLLRNGPTGGNLDDVKRMDTVAASVDPVALDAFGVALMEMDITKVANIAKGEERGLGVADYASLKPREITV